MQAPIAAAARENAIGVLLPAGCCAFQNGQPGRPKPLRSDRHPITVLALPAPIPNRLRVAAISFLNPAPLLWNFEHEPAATRLQTRYDVHYTLPSRCAAQLASGEADLGLVPIASLPFLPAVQAVAGCVIASLERVRSIQLVLRPGATLEKLRSVAADAASRSSAAYVRTLLRTFHGNDPHFDEQPADLRTMLAACDAALLIGDPALLALEDRDLHGSFADCTWIDVAAWWRGHTSLPWVAAVWAVRTDALPRCGISPEELTADLLASRDGGLQQIEGLVSEWTPRLRIPADSIRTYLTRNIHYKLDAECRAAMRRFFELARIAGVLPAHDLSLLDVAGDGA